MDLVKVYKVGDALTLALPAELIETLRLTEQVRFAVERVGEEIVLRRVPSEAQEQPQRRQLSARELLQLPPEERDHILAEAAAAMEAEYRTNRDLTDFEAFGEDDLYDEYSQ